MSPARVIRPRQLGGIPAEAPALSCPRNRIVHGNCIEVMAQLPAESMDLILTDPPYACRYRDSLGRTVANDDNVAWLAPAAHAMYQVLAPDSYMVSFYGWQMADAFLTAWKAAGFRPVGHLVFTKRYASSQRHVRQRHESAYLLAKGNPALPDDPIDDVRGWHYSGNRHHPTEKPVGILEELVEAFCPVDGVVLDPFCGSGSSLVAARNQQRRYYGIDLIEAHVLTARRRVEGAAP